MENNLCDNLTGGSLVACSVFKLAHLNVLLILIGTFGVFGTEISGTEMSAFFGLICLFNAKFTLMCSNFDLHVKTDEIQKILAVHQ